MAPEINGYSEFLHGFAEILIWSWTLNIELQTEAQNFVPGGSYWPSGRRLWIELEMFEVRTLSGSSSMI